MVNKRDHPRAVDAMPERMDGLFVQSAAWFSSGDDEITLHGILASTVYFADRPRREVGHMPTRRFIELWEEGRGTFSDDPPKAVLSFLDLDSAPPGDVSLVLSDPRLEDDELTYSVEVLDGILPSSSGACSLFIDVFRRPLMPASAGSPRRVASTSSL
jgi:hypothetical protein